MRASIHGLFLASLVGLAPTALGQDIVSLAGPWRFQLDPNDRGLVEQWFERNLTGQVRLPGCLTEQGIGDKVTVDTKWIGDIVDRSYFTSPEYAQYRELDNVKIPFWLQPELYYAGPAWYQRDIEIPESWKGRQATLFLERAHWETRVWVDGRSAGTCNALATPHEYDLGTALIPGRHVLTIRVDNRLVIDIGVNSHSISDHTQGNWNGIVGRLEFVAHAPVWIDDLQVFPHLATRSITVKGRIGNVTGQPGKGSLALAVSPGGARGQASVAWEAGGGTFETEVALGDSARVWDEFSPVVYQLTATLDGARDSRTVGFGLREVSTQGTQFVLNGHKVFLRGTLECAIFPRTGYPPTDVESWRRVIGVAKAHGLNNIRFHSWCPPAAAFTAADELGFYFLVECSSWANGTSSLGDGKPVDTWIYQEADRIIRAYGNHPSFLLMAYGNEPGGDKSNAYLGKWVDHYKAADPRRLYTSGAGWPQLAHNQFHVTADPRIQGWGAGLQSRINARPPETRTDYRDYITARKVPVISHEIGQWCVYPNLDEIPKYTGYLKPRNFEIFRDRLQGHGMADQAGAFLLASGKLQTLCYKEDIESALRTPGMGGFQLLDLHDFPGQGTALVGVLDPFWESKGYVTSAEFRRFCNSTVPLARLGKRVFTTDETLEAEIEVAHFGPEPLLSAQAVWRLTDGVGKILASGRLPQRDVPVDNGITLGKVSIPLSSVPAPSRCGLIVTPEGTPFENDWDLWVYPINVDTSVPEGITVVNDLTDEVVSALNNGGKVLLMIPPSRVAPDKRFGKVELGFSSIFWNTAWTQRQAPHTLGILCDPNHPALAAFPTDFHSNWQWWYLATRAGAMILDGLPNGVRPIVQVIDDWFTARRLGLVFEARVAKGRIIVTSIDLQTGLESNPVARQMRHSLLRYMAGNRFDPRTQVGVESIRALTSH